MKKKCSVEECQESSYWKDDGKKGFCSKHYRRWQRHGDPHVCKYATDGEGCVFEGYKIITINGKQKYEHRYIMENFLGRILEPREIVHHVNGNSLDNRIENLMIGSQSEHAKHHAKERYSYLDKPCDTCHKIFRPTTWRIKKSRFTFCSRTCASIARRLGGISHVKRYHHAPRRP